MVALIEHSLTSGATHPTQATSALLASWAITDLRRDHVAQFLMTHSSESELAAFARNAVRNSPQADRRTKFSELLLIPIVSSGAVTLSDNLQIWESAQDPLVQQLIRLFPRDWTIRFFKGIVPAEDLLGMPWQALRIYLDPASVQGDTPKTQTFTRLCGRLPAGVPELGFIVVKAECDKGWPTDLPTKTVDEALHADAPEHATLIRAAQILQLSAWESHLADPDAPQVLSPCGWSQGIGNGMRLWMRLLHDRYGITGYELTLNPREVDLCSLQIRLAGGRQDVSGCTDTQSLNLHLGVRRFALTPHVWAGILKDLHALAGEPCSTAVRM